MGDSLLNAYKNGELNYYGPNDYLNIGYIEGINPRLALNLQTNPRLALRLETNPSLALSKIYTEELTGW